MVKKEWPPKGGEDPKPKPSKGRKGSAAVVTRVNGSLKTIKPKDFAGVTTETLREDAKTKAGTGDGTYKGGPAPRVGGKQKPIAKSGPVSGGTKKQLRQSKRRVNKSAASPAAKRSARKLYR